MSDLPDRVGRAFDDHDAFDREGEATYVHRNTAFDGEVRVSPGDEGRVAFDVTVRVPTLDAVTVEDVAPVVEEGWYETFALRVEDVGGITRRERGLEPTVTARDDEAVVEVSFEDLDPRRGVDDAAAFVEYVEGTYVQGVIPGYEYLDPVAGLIERARTSGGSGGSDDGSGGSNDGNGGSDDGSGGSETED